MHAGSRLLADQAGLTGGFADVLAGFAQRRRGRDPGRVLLDVAVLLADGGTRITDLAVLRNQPNLFGPVASTATAWRVLDGVDERALSRLRDARAAALERMWLQADDVGRLPLFTTAGCRTWPGIGVQLDATLTECHSDKQGAAPTFKGGFGHHTLTAWCDKTGESLAAMLRPGNPGPTTSPSPTGRWRRSPTRTATAPRSWSAPTGRRHQGLAGPPTRPAQPAPP